MDASFADF